MSDGQERRLVDPRDLVTTYEIGARLDRDPTLIWHWARRYDFPAPVHAVGKGGRTQLWWWPEVDRWAKLNAVVVGRVPAEPAVEPNELMSGKEVAEFLGYSSPGTPWSMAQKGTFPQPEHATRPRMWRRSDVEQWARTHPRRPNRRGRPGEV